MSHTVDVLADVLCLFGALSFSSDELAVEMEHYARLVGADVPHHTAVGKRLASLGYQKQRVSVDGKKVSVYRHTLRALKANSRG